MSDPAVVSKLRHIRTTYGASIKSSAQRFACRPEVLAAIMMRETEGGLSSQLDIVGPKGRGDNGHAHGLMQIDDRSYPAFCRHSSWWEPDVNIAMGAAVLLMKRAWLAKHIPILTGAGLERASIAAYNCGEGNVRKAVKAGLDVDAYTAHGNYSSSVLQLADEYLKLEPTPDVDPTQGPA